MKYIIRILFVICIFIFHCRCTNEHDETNLLQLGGNTYILEVNRISEHPNVQFPSDPLSEDDYGGIDPVSEYEVSFSEDLRTVSIMRDSISGLIMEDKDAYKKYDLNKGLFAGGRFILWINDGMFEAEYTVYGSGVPIILSERGNLISF